MRLNKKIGIVVWFLFFALTVFLLFIIPNEYTTEIWVTLGFTVVAFVSQLCMWLSMFKEKETPKGTFYNTPAAMVSTFYMLIQLVICVVTANKIMELKPTIIVNFVVLILCWIVLCMLVASKNHAKKVDSRQKDHHTKL